MSEIETTTIEDLFIECFGGWKDDILDISKKSQNKVEVTMKSGKKYLFGRTGESELYLHTIGQA